MIVKGSIHIGNFIYSRSASDTEDTVDDIRLYATEGQYIVEKCAGASATKGGGVWEATGDVHDRQHPLTSEEDHSPEIEHAGKVAGWDIDGKVDAKLVKELEKQRLLKTPLPKKELKLPHVISDTAPDTLLFDRGVYWYKPPVQVYVLAVYNDQRAWIEITPQKVE